MGLFWGSFGSEITLQTRPRSKGVVFAKAKRDIEGKNRDTLPGPGDYDWKLKTIKKVRNGFSFGKSDLNFYKKENHSLGPGHYNVKYGNNKLKFGVIGKQRRVLGDVKEQTPGYYDIPSCIPNIAKYNYPAWEDRKIRL